MSLLARNAAGRPRSSLFSHRRFADASLDIAARPSFAITPDDRVLCMGSCFARAVGRMLDASGVANTFAGLTHRYNAFTILQALRWATSETFEPRHLVELDDGRAYDPHDRQAVHTGYDSIDQAHAVGRAMYAQLGEELGRADVFVMTLGLAEVWLDRSTGVALNHMPPRRSIAAFDDRFEVVQTTFDENRTALLEILRLIRAVRPGIRVVASVSPIPLSATFTHDDVFVATALGKATLRCALHEAIAAFDGTNVDYFPSYEIVTAQRGDHVFRPTRDNGKPDFQHIRDEFIDAAVRPVFEAGYLRSAKAPVAADEPRDAA